jgi:branched-chain amino acid transport system ATP-binding protein
LGKSIENLPAHKVIAEGIAQVPEGRRLFPYMTVKENLLLGAYPGKAWKVKQKRMEWVMELFPILRERANMPSRLLSGGEQQMLTIGRGLMAQPQLLMVDEPSLGLAPVVQDHLYETLGKLRQSRITILLPEQNALRALGIADRGYVMQDGRIVLEGNAASLMQSNLVKKAYLGR